MSIVKRRRPFCRPDKGPENTDLLFAMPRPRASATLPAGFILEASWTPIRVAEVEANLVSVAFSRVTSLNSKGVVLRLRAHGTFGIIKAPISCDDQALQDATSICYQGTRSDDSFKPNVTGVEAAVGWPLGRAIRPYVGAGYSHPRAQISGELHRPVRRYRPAEGGSRFDRGAIFAGFSWTATSAVELSGELYAVPTDAITARVIGRIRLGR